MPVFRRRGRIDGNADFFQPEADPNGEGAPMDLTLVTGYGPPHLSAIEGRGPSGRHDTKVLDLSDF